MDKEKILRRMFYVIIGLAVLCAVVVGIGSIAARLHPVEKEIDTDKIAHDESMKGIYTMPSVKSKVVQGGLPSEKYDMSPETNPEGSTGMLVKMKDFKGVAVKRKNPVQMLNELSSPAKPSVTFREDVSDGKILLQPSGEMPVKLDYSEGVPEPGMPLEKSGITLITAPVDYKIFSSGSVWKTFADTYGIKLENDFKKNSVVVLVSMSEFPHGIFSIKDVKTEKNNVEILYSVNPLLMSSGIDADMRRQYAYAQIPAGTKKITLRQVE